MTDDLLVRILNHGTHWLLRHHLLELPDTEAGDFDLGYAEGPGYPERQHSVRLADDLLARHLLVLGKSGSGKSCLARRLILHEIKQGHGGLVVDPHRDLVRDVLADIVALARASGGTDPRYHPERFYLIEPGAHTNSVVCINPLAVPPGVSLHAHVEGLVEFLHRLWIDSWGPRLAHCLRRTLVALAQSGCPLTDAERFLIDEPFRLAVLERVSDSQVLRYFRLEFGALPERERLTIVGPVTNKLGAAFAVPAVRAMFGATSQCLDLRSILDSGGWILAAPSRGHLRDAAFFVAALVLFSVQATAMTRSDVPVEARRPFLTILDEFPQYAPPDVAAMLAEIRKFGVRLVLCAQFLEALDEAMRAAVLGNTSCQILHALGPTDAAFLAGQFPDGRALVPVLTQLATGHALVARSGMPPVRTAMRWEAPAHVDDDAMQAFRALIHQHQGGPAPALESEVSPRLPRPTRPQRSRMIEDRDAA